jgi:DNA repair exonuclease SbcCD ATPase subunit
MTQPFDNRDWDLRHIGAAAREIAQCYEDIRTRDAEIERLKDKIRGLEKLNQMTDEEAVMELKAEIERLKTLLTRAADALEEEFGSPDAPEYGVKGPVHELIAELRKAASGSNAP